METEVKIPARHATLDGNLTVPPAARGIVLFVHGSGSSRHSKRNRFVARTLNEAGLATLLFDLLTPEEEAVDMRTAHLRLNIGLLAERLGSATDWVLQEPAARDLRIGYFGSSTGGGAALVAAAGQPHAVGAVVSRGGRPDLAGGALPNVKAPTLLIVGGADDVVIDMPLEELLFGFGIGMYWSSIYEHVTWRQRDALRESSPPTGNKNFRLTRNNVKTEIKRQ